MSIDKVYLVRDGKVTPVNDMFAMDRSHTVCETAHGIEHLYIFDTPEEATATFERWRRQPCESIQLTANGVPQPGDRLPLACKSCKQEIPLGWANLFEDETYCAPCLDKLSAERVALEEIL